MKELAADGIPVAVSCRVLKLSRPPYYRWLTEAVTTAERTEAVRANALFNAHCDDPDFGYRFLADEAEAAGQSMSARTAWRICSANSWWPPVIDHTPTDKKEVHELSAHRPSGVRQSSTPQIALQIR